MKTLQVCSYFTDSKLYRNLFQALEGYQEYSDIFYFTDTSKDLFNLDDGIIISQAYTPLERFFFFVKHGKVYNDLKAKVDPASYSLAHAHSLMSNGYIANRLYRDHGLKYLVAVRRTDLYIFMKYKPYLKGLAVRILEEAEAVIFLSPASLDRAKELFDGRMGPGRLEGKSHIIPNGIDQVFFDHEPEAKLLEGPLKLVFIGKVYDSNKNVDTIIRLVDQLKDQGQDVSLKLIGDIDEPFTKKVQARDYVQATGRLSPEEIIKSLREDHIFIMPSYTETFGLVYVEAMSQGLPVIYTRGQGFDGQFPEGQVGYGVDPNSIEEMEEALAKIQDDYEGMSARAIEGAKAYNWPAIAGQYTDLYQAIRNK